MCAGEREQLGHQIAAAFTGAHHLSEVAGQLAFLVGHESGQRQIGVAVDRRQYVVEIVRNSTGELPQGLDLLGLLKLSLQNTL